MFPKSPSISPLLPRAHLAINSVTLTADTNNPSGYTLTMSTNSNETKLSHLTRPDSIASIDSNTNLANFPSNKWGYSLNSSDYNTIPALTNPATIDSTTAPFSQRSTTVDFGAKANQDLASGTYQNTVTFSAVANYVSNPTFGGITTMQQMTTQICQDETKPTKEATNTTTEHTTDTSLVPEATLTDTRDGKTYVVRKLADGNCWMSQNLALSPDGNTTYTEADTDLHDGRTFQAPAASSLGTKWNSGSNSPHYLKPQTGYEYFQNGIAHSSTGQPTESTGSYYDWPMATALSGQSLTNDGDEAPDSICPKGWRLPQKEGNKSYQNLLINSYNTPTNSDAALLVTPMSFIHAGVYDFIYGSFVIQGGSGVLWSSTTRSSSDVYFIGLGGQGVTPQGHYDQGYGSSIRCVAR